MIELLNILKDYNEERNQYRNLHQLSQGKHFDDYDPQVGLEIDRYMINQVVVDFGLQVNILSRETWIKLEGLAIQQMNNYIKLVY